MDPKNLPGGGDDAAQDADEGREDARSQGDDQDGQDGADGDGEGDEDKPLGPKGEKALAEMKATTRTLKAERNASRAEVREWNQFAQELGAKNLSELRAMLEEALSEDDDGKDAGKKDAGKSSKVDEARIRREAQTAADQRIIRAEVKAAAGGKLADPADAVRFLDLSKFELDDDGNVDDEEIGDAIAELLEKKPYLAASAQGGKRFKGTADGGAKQSKPNRPRSLGEAVAARLKP